MLSLYAAIAGGSVVPVGHDGTDGVGGAVISQEDIDQHLKSPREIFALTAEQIASLTGAHHDAVQGWIKDGLLRATKSPEQHGMPWQVQVADLVNFLIRYTPLASLAISSGSTSRRISADLAKAHVPTLRTSTGRGALVSQVDLVNAIRRVSN